MVLTKLCIGYYFVFQGIIGGVFAGILPLFKEHHGLDDTELGFHLFVSIAGGMSAVFFVPMCSDRIGSARVLMISSAIVLLSLPFLGYVSTLLSRLIFLFAFGWTLAFVDVSENEQAVLYEKIVNHASLGSFHALYAIGALAGALLSGMFIENKINLFNILLYTALICGIGCLIFSFRLIGFDEENTHKLAEATTESTEDNSKRGSKRNNRQDEELELHYEKIKAAAADVMKSLTSSSTTSLSFPGNNKKQTPVKTTTLMSNTGTTSTGRSDTNVELTLNQSNTSAYEFLLVDQDDDEDGDEDVTIEFGNTNKQIPSKEDGERDIDYKLLLALMIVGTLAFLLEGAIGDWSALYLEDDCGAPPALTTLAFAVFQLFVVIGRLASDKVVDVHFSKAAILRISGMVTACGLCIIAIAPIFSFSVTTTSTSKAYLLPLLISLFGFALTGTSVACVSPIVMSAAGSVKGINSNTAIAYISGVTYAGFLIGPPILGLVADISSLSWSFVTCAGFSLLMVPFGMFVR